MGVITTAIRNLAGRVRPRVATSGTGQSTVTRPVTGSLTPTVGYQTPIDKGPSWVGYIGQVSVAGNTGSLGVPKT